MPEGFYNATEGSGKKLHTWQRTIGANDVHDEFVQLGEQSSLVTYQVTSSGVSIATANDHPLQLMAGASLNVFLRRVRIYQLALATTATVARFQLVRLTTAGTGGTVVTPRVLPLSGAGSGATAMTLPTAKGTEGQILDEATAAVTQTLPTAGTDTLLVDWDYDKLLRIQGPGITAGVTNGLAVKSTVAIAACTVIVVATFSEASYS